MNVNTKYEMRPIGRVLVQAGRFAVQIDEQYRPALLELHDWSHIQVVWWCHLLDSDEYRNGFLVAEKPYKQAPERIGVFATRSPARPNPLAITNTALLAVDSDAGLLEVAYIDAEDGSPVVDVKPYTPATERIRDVQVPDWANRWPMWQEDSATFDWSAVFENAQ